MGWVYLTIAGVLEVAFTSAMRYAESFTRPLPTLLVFVFAVFSLYFVAKAAETIPLSVAYTVWGAIGAVGTVFLGLYMFNEALKPVQLLFLALVLASVIGLKLVSDQ